MHPASSIILFTTLSGLGFGMLTILGLGYPDVSGFTAFVFFFIAYALAVGGLSASLFHLGNPQRALKGFSQWQTSWLSREAWLAVLALLTMGLYAIGVIFFHARWSYLGFLGLLLCLATVFATSMIYAQLKTVPRWNTISTPIVFLLFSLSGGSLLAGQLGAAINLMALTTVMQILVWIRGDRKFSNAGSTIETATGLGRIGKTRMFEGPHSSDNYLMKEMVYVVARKHILKLRVIGILGFSILPIVILKLFLFSHLLTLLAVLLHIAGVLIIRWLFFASAEHTVGLYYGKR